MPDIRENIKNKYNTAVEDYVVMFKNTYFRNVECEDWWVSDEIGDVLVVNDYFFSFNDIKYAINNKVSKHELFKWYDHSLAHGMNNCEGSPPTLREWWEDRKNKTKLAEWKLKLYDFTVMDFSKDLKMVLSDPAEDGWYATVTVGHDGVSVKPNKWSGKWERPMPIDCKVVARTEKPLDIDM